MERRLTAFLCGQRSADSAKAHIAMRLRVYSAERGKERYAIPSNI